MMAPVATPALIWMALATRWSLTTIIVVLVAVALLSDLLAHIVVRVGGLTKRRPSPR